MSKKASCFSIDATHLCGLLCTAW